MLCRKHRAGVDVHSCSQFLLELYSRWVLPSSSARRVPVALVSEVVRSVSLPHLPLGGARVCTHRHAASLQGCTCVHMQTHSFSAGVHVCAHADMQLLCRGACMCTHRHSFPTGVHACAQTHSFSTGVHTCAHTDTQLISLAQCLKCVLPPGRSGLLWAHVWSVVGDSLSGSRLSCKCPAALESAGLALVHEHLPRACCSASGPLGEVGLEPSSSVCWRLHASGAPESLPESLGGGVSIRVTVLEAALTAGSLSLLPLAVVPQGRVSGAAPSPGTWNCLPCLCSVAFWCFYRGTALSNDRCGVC